MRKQNMPTTFSGFQWGIAGFCLPILLWPLALFISPNLLENPHLSSMESTLMSIFFWTYPLILAIISRVLYKLHEKNSSLAKKLLVVSTIIFYVITYYVCTKGFA